jgi:hypothetical protein
MFANVLERNNGLSRIFGKHLLKVALVNIAQYPALRYDRRMSDLLVNHLHTLVGR